MRMRFDVNPHAARPLFYHSKNLGEAIQIELEARAA